MYKIGMLQEKYTFTYFKKRKLNLLVLPMKKKIHLSPSVDKAITAAKLKIIG